MTAALADDDGDTIGVLYDSLAPGESAQRGPYRITRPAPAEPTTAPPAPTGWRNPGSDEAVAAGCICPVMDNNHGKHPPRPPSGWWMRPDCPLHQPLARIKGT